jgi:hypothetical protein
MASWELYAFEPIRREVLERRETSGFQWKWAAGRKAEEGSLNPVVKLNAHLFQKDAAEQEMLRYGTAAVMLIG